MKNVITQLTTYDDVALVNLQGIPTDLSFISEVFGIFAAAGINVDMISLPSSPSSKHNLSFTVPGADLEKTLGLAAVLREQNSDIKISVVEGCCKLVLFGEAMREYVGVAHLAFKALSGAGIPIHMVTTSETDISFLIDDMYTESAANLLKKAFYIS